MIGFAVFLFATKPAMNSAQLIFRIALLALGVLGLVLSLAGRRR